jgi:FAD/FMN-containing dehydrogenase
MSCWTAGPLARSASEIESRMRQNASAWTWLAASTPSLARPCPNAAASEVGRAFPGTISSGFGHLGDGNVHFHVRPAAAMTKDAFDDQAEAITRMVHDLVTAAGGSISAEHGIGQMKRDELARLAPERVAHLRAIKHALDPEGIMNPGKLV